MNKLDKLVIPSDQEPNFGVFKDQFYLDWHSTIREGDILAFWHRENWAVVTKVEFHGLDCSSPLLEVAYKRADGMVYNNKFHPNHFLRFKPIAHTPLIQLLYGLNFEELRKEVGRHREEEEELINSLSGAYNG